MSVLDLSEIGSVTQRALGGYVCWRCCLRLAGSEEWADYDRGSAIELASLRSSVFVHDRCAVAVNTEAEEQHVGGDAAMPAVGDHGDVAVDADDGASVAGDAKNADAHPKQSVAGLSKISKACVSDQGICSPQCICVLCLDVLRCFSATRFCALMRRSLDHFGYEGAKSVQLLVSAATLTVVYTHAARVAIRTALQSEECSKADEGIAMVGKRSTWTSHVLRHFCTAALISGMPEFQTVYCEGLVEVPKGKFADLRVFVTLRHPIDDEIGRKVKLPVLVERCAFLDVKAPFKMKQSRSRQYKRTKTQQRRQLAREDAQNDQNALVLDDENVDKNNSNSSTDSVNHGSTSTGTGTTASTGTSTSTSAHHSSSTAPSPPAIFVREGHPCLSREAGFVIQNNEHAPIPPPCSHCGVFTVTHANGGIGRFPFLSSGPDYRMHFAEPTARAVEKALMNMHDLDFVSASHLLPIVDVATIGERERMSMFLRFDSADIHVYGRYNKYTRSISQTPWAVRDTEAVSVFIEQELEQVFGSETVSFAAAGREDVDVRMLGRGRPFAMILQGCRKAASMATPSLMQRMEDAINQTAQGKIRVTGLRLGNAETTAIITSGSDGKEKTYRCLIRARYAVTQEQLDLLCNSKSLSVEQDTPLRVVHRRSQTTRTKMIHWMKAFRLSTLLREEGHSVIVDDVADDLSFFVLDVHTSAGTYVKEFVHSDAGRTRPSLSSLLDVECDLITLDVLDIAMADIVQ